MSMTKDNEGFVGDDAGEQHWRARALNAEQRVDTMLDAIVAMLTIAEKHEKRTVAMLDLLDVSAAMLAVQDKKTIREQVALVDAAVRDTFYRQMTICEDVIPNVHIAMRLREPPPKPFGEVPEEVASGLRDSRKALADFVADRFEESWGVAPHGAMFDDMPSNDGDVVLTLYVDNVQGHVGPWCREARDALADAELHYSVRVVYKKSTGVRGAGTGAATVSGSSLDYLCWNELDGKAWAVEAVVSELRRLGLDDAAARAQQALDGLRGAEAIRQDMQDVWEAVEWMRSGDCGDEEVAKSVAAWRAKQK
jgi:hypothetical protein